MRTAYQYRLRPTASQVALMGEWLELLRRQYNYRLAERFNGWEQNRCNIHACSLTVCHLPELKDKPDFYSQKRDLVNTKALFPEYQAIHSQVLQDCLQRVQRAFDRWLKGDCNGKRAGRPRFKGVGRYRSFTFPQMKQDCIRGQFIHLPKIGPVKLVQHRPLPDGFVIKTATVARKADGWYVTLSLQDSSVPEWSPDPPTWENTMGIDLGLSSFLVTDEGEVIEVPQYYRKAQKPLKRLQRSVSRKQKGSNRYQKAVKRLSKAHQKVANQRRDFHHKVAHQLLQKGRHIAHEALNIKGLARTRLAKSIHDAGWGEFLQILAAKAERAGLLTIAGDPRGSSQGCSGCGREVPKELHERWHDCPHCGLRIGRDHNSARVIKSRAVGRPVLQAQEMSCYRAGVTGKPALYASA
ncbi:transposase [Synechococcus sp. 65AY6Li]|uniref:RNA-guided endonuclease InsQ/TnpB family protein n=1 Tax=unclassified Synechococcus TaxID=2626047 RepID=UPI0000694197|nr:MULTISPECIES: RNA-guided endonuclease TnpB family protein [unclassified Synechococcus]ABC98984.1 ISSoc5, transposase [Synechococcus sp. JA-3-3Ab]PIK90945.1 transposase [Synechococcus sp. 65AY6Li]